MANRLASETSPYLLQHAHNPVDWYPWGPEAFAVARRENKPILLSVGYSSCHWCHVMERESFEDDQTARLMNERFVSVKVDREERPDVDGIYMQAVQAMTGHGGWPMTVFLTPGGEPFWGGTYFPPDDRHGMPSFRRVLTAVADAWRNRADDIDRVTQSMREMYASATREARSSGVLSADVLERARRGLLAAHDPRHGGFGGAPKFPQPMAMEFLLQQWARTGDTASLDAVRQSFLAMARGGICDQVGGGFARYAVDAVWLVPHFEKMLYDNALLLRLGVHLWQATGDAEVRRVCEETLGWVAREMTAPDGGFWSALDADSEGHEGKFYTWTIAEIRAALGGDADAAIAWWGVTEEGNFEGRNILHVANARATRPPRLDAAREKLLAVRETRVRPGRDEKVLASWNGLMLRAVAECARAFGDEKARALAERNAGFLFPTMLRNGRVLRSWKDGNARTGGFLEDHAALGLAALAMYDLTFDRRWLDHAIALEDVAVRQFFDNDLNAFFDTPADHEALITRPRDATDNATPSGTSLAAELLLRLGNLVGDADMLRRGNWVLETIAAPMAQYPLAFGHALTAADLAVNGAVELSIVGDPGDAAFRELAAAAGSVYAPSLISAGGLPEHAAGISTLADRPARGGRPTAYVCRSFVCSPPIDEANRLREVMRSPGPNPQPPAPSP